MAILICWFALSGLSQTLLDAAMVDGAGRLTRFRADRRRLRASALAVAWLVSLAIACGELPASILVVPAGVTTVPIRVFGLLHSGVTNQAAAICLTEYFRVSLGGGRQSQWLGRRWSVTTYGRTGPRELIVGWRWRWRVCHNQVDAQVGEGSGKGVAIRASCPRSIAALIVVLCVGGGWSRGTT